MVGVVTMTWEELTSIGVAVLVIVAAMVFNWLAEGSDR